MNFSERLFNALAGASAVLGRKLSKAEWLAVAEDFCAKEGKKPRKKKAAEMTDDEWIRSLEAEPALAGVDIRREIGKGQLWAKERRRMATRRFLVNWLMKADRTFTASQAGKSSRTAPVVNPYVEPENWQPTARRLFSGYEGEAWGDLATDRRLQIIKAML